MKIWDLRKSSRSLMEVKEKLFSRKQAKMDLNLKQDCIAAAAFNEKYEKSYLNFYDLEGNIKTQIHLDEQQVTDLRWSHKLNQILVAQGNKIKIFFDSEISSKGAL